MRLYYVPKTRATRPRWVLEELGVPYELVRLDPARGETRTPEHLARHPLGHVPVLEDGDTRLFESAAICLHLADRFPAKKLAPPAGSAERGLLYQWLFFTMTELEPPLAAIATERRKPEGQRDTAAIDLAAGKAVPVIRVFEPALQHGRWLVGDAFSVADVVCGSVLLWARAMKLYGDLPAIDAYLARLRERPAWQRAMAD